MKWNLFSSKRAFALSLVWVFIASGVAFAEKSMWQKFKDFFNPGESIECSGPVCDEVHSLEDKISKVEGKYSRERRPSNKERYKKELDSLNVVRDSLVSIIREQQVSDSLKNASAKANQPVAASCSSVSIKSSASQQVSSASLVSSSAVAVALPACKPDTVFLRDTVVVHDTLYVVVTNKPVEVPASSASSENLGKTASSASSENLQNPASSASSENLR